MSYIPTQIEPYSPTEIFFNWNHGVKYAVPYIELRYHCPCAGCIDEHTGERTLQRSAISPEIRPLQVQTVGRYAIQFTWSDGHETGMYHFDRLFEICQKQGRNLSAFAPISANQQR